MDPNETLKELRHWAGEGYDAGDAGDAAADFEALDTWLRNGGFLPTDWAHTTKHEAVIVDLLNRWVSTATSVIWETSGSIGSDLAGLHAAAIDIAADAGVNWQPPESED